MEKITARTNEKIKYASHLAESASNSFSNYISTIS